MEKEQEDMEKYVMVGMMTFRQEERSLHTVFEAPTAVLDSAYFFFFSFSQLTILGKVLRN